VSSILRAATTVKPIGHMLAVSYSYTMTLALTGIALAVVLTLLCIPLQNTSRLLLRLLAWPTALLFILASFYGFITRPNFALVIVVVLSFYQAINLLRLQSMRLLPTHLQRVSLKTWAALTIVQVCALIAWVLIKATYISDQALWFLLSCVVACLTIYSWAIISRRSKYIPPITNEPPPFSGLPTVSVLIPARNETDDLEACLESWVRSDYPKLEIIVLDDCSQMSRTPEIIRQFAHEGVRFIPGKPVKRGWLAKNQAYEALAAEATGELLVFCGVDTRVQTDSLRLLTADFYAQQVQMASVLPHNFLQAGQVSVIQLMRYGRELIRWPHAEQPPVLSTLWMIQATALQALGGFAAVKHSVIPEEYFSRVLDADKAYTFWLGPAAHGVASNKHIQEQYETAVRTLYPLFHKQLELVALAGLLVGLIAFLPPVAFIISLFTQDWLLLVAAFVCIFFNLAAYRRLMLLTYGQANKVHLFVGLYAAASWLQALNYSMYKYEFSEVEWKGRNICMPVMNRVAMPLKPMPGSKKSFKVWHKNRKR